MPAQRPWTAEEWKITVLAGYWQYFLTLHSRGYGRDGAAFTELKTGCDG